MKRDSFWQRFYWASVITALRTAARLENVGLVKYLLGLPHYQFNREEEFVYPHGYTPLHSAAIAINPNAEVASCLINSRYRTKWLDSRTDVDCGGNTALHLAAANANVTEDFIQQFEKADSVLRNSQMDTPYHVAAKSSNQQAIIHMLNVFSPTNNSWDVDVADEGRKFNTVINICARNGNAEAVALLIKHGADISKGVLHEIVLESVRQPEKIDALLGVYEAIVKNAVTWRTLEESIEFLKYTGPDSYMELFRKTMVWLLTTPLEKYRNKNVIQCAVDHAASAFFWRIVNTSSVFRFDGAAADELFDEPGDDTNEVSDRPGDTKKNQTNRYCTVFDVTHFIEETIPEPSDSDQKKEEPEQSHDTSATEHTGDKGSCVSKHNFDNLLVLSKPYLVDLLLTFDQWRSSNVLSTQPLKELTEPYIKVVQRFYSIFGLLHLLFMICFTAFHLPGTCSVARMFNVSNALCNSSISNSSVDTNLSIIGHQRSWTSVLWLIWPVIVVSMLIFTTLHYVEQVILSSRQQSEKIVLKTKDLRLSFRREFIGTLLQSLLPASFCFALFAWLGIYLTSESYEYYVAVTGVVLLLGWIANLYFFGAVRKDFSIFSLVVSEIMRKDIPSFMLFFGFTVLAYSFAMHALRAASCTPSEFVDDTFFSVLSSAFGIGDFYEATMDDSTCASKSMQYVFEMTYFLYVCATMIILLNVLIAMLNHRYERAKSKTETIWRFQMLSVMRALERHKTLAKVVKKYLMPNRLDKSLFFKDQRAYLQLVLPADEQLVSLHVLGANTENRPTPVSKKSFTGQVNALVETDPGHHGQCSVLY